MDEFHAKLANHILGNDENAAVLELTLQGVSIYFHEATQIVICGADLSPKLNRAPLRLNIPVNVSKGQQLDFGERKYVSTGQNQPQQARARVPLLRTREQKC